jgi:Class III cytochrome C family
VPQPCRVPVVPRPTTRLARAIACAIVLFGSALSLAQGSPGSLSRAHQQLDGSANCSQCHTGPKNATLRCLECHSEIASRIASGRGFHASVSDKNNGSQKCATCHAEHRGLQTALVGWQQSPEDFDHSKTGWELKGHHAEVECAKCHNSNRVVSAERASIRIRNLNRTFLGAPTECLSCHRDEHQRRFGKNCEQCHTPADWHKVSNFTHVRTKFPLTGSHTQVACEGCHTPTGPQQKLKLTGLKFNTCNSCHQDPHQGTFPATCQTCHNTNEWKAVSNTGLRAKFDHAKTSFPLAGQHASVACARCHAGGNFKRAANLQKCSDCHRDPHNGQFAQRGDHGECSSCHTVGGWKQFKFAVVDHNNTGYPLEGEHVKVACAKCHTPAGKSTVFKIKFGACMDCHRDAHLGQFKNTAGGDHCETCHTVKGFRPSTFSLAKHRNSKFPLSGPHLAVTCAECHKKTITADLQEVAMFRFEDQTCSGCHQDPHGTQFQARMQKTGADGKPLGCLACHSLSSWKDLTKFDHSSTSFTLVGSHRAVTCGDCHKGPNFEVKLMHADFRAAPKDCEGCHSDPHGGQFNDVGKPALCSSCHNSNKWKPVEFDHTTRTRYPLQGEHVNVRCGQCHTSTRLVEGVAVVIYKPTPTQCAACHKSGSLEKRGGR